MSSKTITELMQPDSGKKLGENKLRRNLKSLMQVLHSLQDFPLRNHNRVKSGAWHQMQELYSLCVNV